MNLLFAATTGWGKSYHCQGYTERNLDEYDQVVLLDFKDEYRGLVKAGLASFWQAGPREAARFGPGEWRALLDENDHLVVARHHLDAEHWRAVCADVVTAGRRTPRSTLFVVDEAHFVAPQAEKLPDPIKGLATTGRGEQNSAMWVTQRLTEIDSTILSQCTAQLLGGFTSDRDLKKLREPLDYDERAHKAGGVPVTGLPEELHVDGEPISVRKWEEGETVTGSEWIWSDDSGGMERLNTADLRMRSEHVGAAGKKIHRPAYG